MGFILGWGRLIPLGGNQIRMALSQKVRKRILSSPLIINHLPLLISSLTHNKMILSWYPMFNVKWSMIDVK